MDEFELWLEGQIRFLTHDLSEMQTQIYAGIVVDEKKLEEIGNYLKSYKTIKNKYEETNGGLNNQIDKIVEETIRFYAERKNAEVAFIETDGEKVNIYEKDVDEGHNARMTAQLLGISFDKDSMAKGYALVPSKMKELTATEEKKDWWEDNIYVQGSAIFALFIIGYLLALLSIALCSLYAIALIITFFRYVFRYYGDER